MTMNELLDLPEDVPLLSKPTHLSASTISSFIERRGEWYMNKISRIGKFSTSDFFQRGKAVEKALQTWLETKDETKALQDGLEELYSFDEILPGDQYEKLKQHAEDLPAYLQKAIETYGSYLHLDQHTGSQVKIDLKLKGCSIPIIGYIDFTFGRFWTDCKVLSRKPSGLSQAYSIQGAIYHAATGKPGIFTCFSKIKSGVQCHEEHLLKQHRTTEYWMKYLTMAAKAIEGVYDASLDGDTESLLKHLSFPDLNGFFSERDKERALEHWA